MQKGIARQTSVSSHNRNTAGWLYPQHLPEFSLEHVLVVSKGCECEGRADREAEEKEEFRAGS